MHVLQPVCLGAFERWYRNYSDELRGEIDGRQKRHVGNKRFPDIFV